MKICIICTSKLLLAPRFYIFKVCIVQHCKMRGPCLEGSMNLHVAHALHPQHMMFIYDDKTNFNFSTVPHPHVVSYPTCKSRNLNCLYYVLFVVISHIVVKIIIFAYFTYLIFHVLITYNYSIEFLVQFFTSRRKTYLLTMTCYNCQPI